MKKVLALVMALVMVLALCACGQQAAPAATQAPAAEAAAPAAEAAPAAQKFTMDVALHSVDSVAEPAVEQFKEAVETATDGNVTVNIFYGGQLDTEAENITQLSTGEVQCALLGSLYPEQVLPEYNITGIPFAFPSEEAVEDYWNGEIGQTMSALSIERADIRLAGLVSRGARLLTSNK